MENKKQHNSVMMAVAAFVLVIIVIGAIGFFTIGHDDEVIQGQIEVEE